MYSCYVFSWIVKNTKNKSNMIIQWQFWQLSILATSILATFNFGNLQFWQLSILKFSVLTIFNLGYFQAKFLNGSQQEQQHINCMDLAIKKYWCMLLFCNKIYHFKVKKGFKRWPLIRSLKINQESTYLLWYYLHFLKGKFTFYQVLFMVS